MMFLMETRCNHKKMETWRVKLVFKGKLIVNSVGKVGGLCLFWTENVEVDLITYSQNHIDVKIIQGRSYVWRFTRFYGHPEATERVHSWTLLRLIAGMANMSWLRMGDFNEILYDSKKLGGANKKWHHMADFREAVEDCNLENMEFSGPKFTWSNKREGD